MNQSHHKFLKSKAHNLVEILIGGIDKSFLAEGVVYNYLEEFFDAAYQEGYEEGYDIGYDEGRDSGYEEGYQDSLAEIEV